MTDAETIELASLGRPFQLGMLYDCRRDMLIPGITLWDADMLEKHISVRPQPNTDFKIITSDSTEAKAHALNVEASLEASFLGGLVSVKGSAKFLNDKKTSKHQTRVTLQYRTTTRFEQLTMDHLGAGNVKHSNVFQEGSATHVVTAVLYGAQAFFVFDREVSTSENQQEIEGHLQAAIKKIPLISIEGEASLKMTEDEKRQADNFNCTFHGDLALENNPVTFQDALKVYCELPHLLGEKGEKAVPMRVWLYPLRKLDSAAAQLVRQISVGLVRRCQRTLDEMQDLDVQCQDLLKDQMAIQFPQIKEKLFKFRDLCSEYKLVFQKFLCKALPNIRGGGEDEQKLADVLTSKERSPFQNTLMAQFLADREREMNVVRSYLDIMNGVPVVSSSSELDKIVLNQAHDYVVCFAFSSLQDKEEYLSDLETYLREQSMGDTTQSPYQHKEMAEKWFRSGQVTTQTRQTIQLFIDFKQSNQQKEKLAFCVASIPGKLITASSVHVYERGTLLSAQFELPSKPGAPTVIKVEHNCVHLQMNPPANGMSSVQFYHVLYQTKQGSEWKEVNTDGKTSQVIMGNLNPYTEYRFSCQAVCRPGVSLTSSATDYVKTCPSSPPGPPKEKSVDSDQIKMTWDLPTAVGDAVTVIGYVVEYKECINTENQESSCNTWQSIKSINRECTLEGLKEDTSYSIRVYANCGEAGKSLPSSEMVLRTIKASDSKPRVAKSVKQESALFLELSTLLKKGNPSIYRLNLEEGLREGVKFEQYFFGKQVERENNKVILLLGATGAGKTTLVNVMINYILGVQWEDRYRFKLIHEQTNRSQAESQTSIVTSYNLYNQRGFQIPYSMTIIDTPGFGDTRGLAHDKQITEQLKSFLCSPRGIDHIDAVCFVVQASLARLSATQKYIFDSILSIFGKDIAGNIVMLVTFADGKEIPVLEAVQAAELPCHKNKKGKPTHFKFNNSALFAQNSKGETNSEDNHSEEDEEDGDGNQLEKIVWTSTFKQMKAFFKTLKDLESKDLTLTKRVLEERERLENAMARLTPQISAGLTKLSEIKKFKQSLENEGKTMKENENFEVELEELVAKRKNTNFFSVNCNTCLFSCHSSCFLPETDDIRTCAVMDDHGYCVVCPKHCQHSVHFREKALWEYESVKVKKTTKELKDNFMKAMGEFMSTKQMLEKLEDEFHLIEDKLMNLIRMSSNCLQRLEEIALKPKSLSIVEYVEVLIRTEEDEKKPGFEERVISLNEMKKNAEILAKIARGEKLLPDERRIMSQKMKSFNRSVEKVRGMQKVLQAWTAKNE
ncbi:hypothetical protein JZ751_010825 [Albula glossodonta]|uniref:Fibronectin type-III domain-containing protein n=1 Tax=Albula glossodonta TaxID=121402 RepID=A0A8T2MZ84_9TELE|nr:hypothetical protein JZ751_010825 [Albula glossodonta]